MSERGSQYGLHNVIADRLGEAGPDRGRIGQIDSIDEFDLAGFDAVGKIKILPGLRRLYPFGCLLNCGPN
jgi:hypothetical protein